MTLLNQGDRILFIGDSITDVGRHNYHQTKLGAGYPQLVAAYLLSTYPDQGWHFINRGVSGNRLRDMARRWETDCLNLEPDLVSILIGINDIWHNKTSHDAILPDKAFDEFESLYRDLLESLVVRGKKIVVMEPFLLPWPMDRLHWMGEVDRMRGIVADLAQEVGATFLPLHDRLNEAGRSYGYETYTGNDGVHPTVAGHGLIARAWLEGVGMIEA